MKRFGLYMLLVLLWSCSPRVSKVPNIPAKPPVDRRDSPEIKAEPAFTTAHIAVLIPFKLNTVNLNTASRAQLAETDMAIDFYQGLQMGIDSAAASGLNFKVHVYDSRDNNTQLSVITKKEHFKNSQLIIGPVFPEGVKYMTSYAIANDVPVISPLAASKPGDFNNPKLISIVNHIDQHGEKIAAYIGTKYNAERGIVVLINPAKKDDDDFAVSVKAFLQKKYPALIVQEYSSAAVFETKMIKGKRYAVVVCSSDVAFVTPTIDKLARLSKIRANDYDIQLFGHPAWLKQNYNTEQLQTLHTVISTSYLVNYKEANVIAFVKKYRTAFNFEPSEYSFKGFDIGFYFGRLLARHGKNYLDFITKEKYKGLHNTFSFTYDPLFGYYNKDLSLVQYKNMTLTPVN